MLPDYPEFKKRLTRLLLRRLDEQIRSEPMLQQVRRIQYFEGDSYQSGVESGEVSGAKFTEVAAAFTPNRTAVIEKGPGAIVDNIDEIAKDIQKQQAELIFTHIASTSEKAGTSVDAKGRPFDFDMFIEALERIQIEFDEEGKPLMPSFYVNQIVAQKIAAQIPEWKRNPDYKRRMDDLIEQKRKEWRDRESRRRLVD
jgi:hypothetical protein